MEKTLLNSEEEYFNLCKREHIGEVSRRYCSQYCFIADGIPCDVSHVCDNDETLRIKTKPATYPCMFVWHWEDIDGQFIYENDFKKKE